MDVAWTKGKSEEEKKLYVESLKRAKWVFDDLKVMLGQSNMAVEASEISPKSYDNPNWSYRQAHANGYKQCLRDINKLITIDQ